MKIIKKIHIRKDTQLVPLSTEIPLSTKRVLIQKGKEESRTLAGQSRHVLNRWAEDMVPAK